MSDNKVFLTFIAMLVVALLGTVAMETYKATHMPCGGQQVQKNERMER